MLLLRTCVVCALIFLAQVVPPSLAMAEFERYDAEVSEFVLTLMTLPDRAPPAMCGKSRLSRFKRRLQLPIRHNGAGLSSLKLTAPAAFFASVVTAVHDDFLRERLPGLARFAEPTAELLMQRLQQYDLENKPAAYLPSDTAGSLVNPTFFVELLSKEPALKLQKAWTRTTQANAEEALRAEESEASECDFIASNTHGRASTILVLKLSTPATRRVCQLVQVPLSDYSTPPPGKCEGL